MNCNDIATIFPLYLSGELDPPRKLAFTQHLQACEACATELERQLELDALLRDHICCESVDSSALDQQVRSRIRSERSLSRTRALAVAASIGVVLFAAGLGYWTVFPAKAASLLTDAARDHRNEVIRRQHRSWISSPKLIAGLAQRNGVPPMIVPMLTPPGSRLVQAKLCRLDGRVFLHLVYARDTGEFSAYLSELNTQPLPGPIRETENGKLLHEADSGAEHIASFQTGKLTAMFVTDQSSADALSLARFAARVL